MTRCHARHDELLPAFSEARRERGWNRRFPPPSSIRATATRCSSRCPANSPATSRRRWSARRRAFATSRARPASTSRGCRSSTRRTIRARRAQRARIDGARRQGRALIRGSLGIEDLLAPVAAPDSGLRTETRLTHAFFLDLPGQDRGLLLADAHLNVAPNLAAKRDIVQNTAHFAHRARRRYAAGRAAGGDRRRIRGVPVDDRSAGAEGDGRAGRHHGRDRRGPVHAGQRALGRGAHANGVRPTSPAMSTCSSRPGWKRR